MTVRSSRGDTLILRDDVESDLPLLFCVSSQNSRFIMDMSGCKMWFQTKEKAWKWQQQSIFLPPLSKTTHLAVAKILDTGSIELADLKDSFLLHKPFWKYFAFISKRFFIKT